MMMHHGKRLVVMGCEVGQVVEGDEQKQLDWMLLEYESHRKTRDYIRALNHYCLSHPAQWQVEDNGGGVAPDLLPHLFDGSLQLSGRGGADHSRFMGIGLIVCRTIVEAHGGSIRAENRPGGARFEFTLPLANTE